MTTTDDILTAAHKRLDAIAAGRAALDAEEAKLRRMIAAADQVEPAKVAPLPSHEPVPWPMPFIPAPQPHPLTPYQPPIYDPLAPWWVNPGPYCGSGRYAGQIIDKGYTVS